MYYKELARRLRRRYLDSLGNVVLQNPSDVYFDCNQAASAISDLLARVESAEADRDRLREAMKPNCLMCNSMHENGNCTEVGGFCTAVPAAYCPLIPKLIARAEAAEAQRDAAIKELDGVASAVDDLADFIDEQIHPLVQYDMYTSLRENADAISMWQYESEWRGQNEK